MKVKEARKEIENIDETIKILNNLNPDMMKRVFDYIETDNQEEAEWYITKLHIVNAMTAYKNILKEKIEEADLN